MKKYHVKRYSEYLHKVIQKKEEKKQKDFDDIKSSFTQIEQELRSHKSKQTLNKQYQT